MYNVEWTDAEGVLCNKDIDGLTPAMDLAKELNCLVIIKGNGMVSARMVSLTIGIKRVALEHQNVRNNATVVK